MEAQGDRPVSWTVSLAGTEGTALAPRSPKKAQPRLCPVKKGGGQAAPSWGSGLLAPRQPCSSGKPAKEVISEKLLN